MIEKFQGEYRWVGVMREQWCSICSAHQRYHEGCPRCAAGRYINLVQSQAEHYLYERDPAAWCRFANREGSSSRQFLEEVFPNLKR